MGACAWTYLTLVSLTLLFAVNQSAAQVFVGSDERCRCVCPLISAVFPSLNDTSHRTVYIKNETNGQQCSCLFVVDDILKRESNAIAFDVEVFCLRCSCKHEKRSSTTQKVVIILIVATMGVLFIYGLFLLILDPLLNKRSGKYTTQINEVSGSSIDASSTDDQFNANRQRSASSAGSMVTNVVNRVQRSQAKWKGQVREQREHIFSRHTMLN